MKFDTKKLPDQKKCSISLIGLGYVGLPLAVAFAKVDKNKKTPLIIWRETFLGHVRYFLKNKNVNGKLRSSIKTYRPQTTSKKCISVLKCFAKPSIIGRTDHARRFKIIAFIWLFS